jgi:predicted methyltransferase
MKQYFDMPIEQAREYANLADIVINSRPTPNREYDQIYMLNGDMVRQLWQVAEYIQGKNIIFLGDGDGMSMLLGLFAVKNYIASPKSMTVLDFDQRIINNISRFFHKHEISRCYETKCQLYNAIEPITSELCAYYDLFYINPPYGSKNKGVGAQAWLHRCMDLCKSNAIGCIILPYDNDQLWTKEAMVSVQDFLLHNGFVVRHMVPFMHSYHLDELIYFKIRVHEQCVFC